MIKGNNKVYIIVNTIDFNKDNNYSVMDCSYADLANYGISDNQDAIFNMKVGQVSNVEKGCYVMRVA
jgi:hypothetical protein